MVSRCRGGELALGLVADRGPERREVAGRRVAQAPSHGVRDPLERGGRGEELLEALERAAVRLLGERAKVRVASPLEPLRGDRHELVVQAHRSLAEQRQACEGEHANERDAPQVVRAVPLRAEAREHAPHEVVLEVELHHARGERVRRAEGDR